jgi:hypothetical protein
MDLTLPVLGPAGIFHQPLGFRSTHDASSLKPM